MKRRWTRLLWSVGLTASLCLGTAAPAVWAEEYPSADYVHEDAYASDDAAAPDIYGQEGGIPQAGDAYTQAGDACTQADTYGAAGDPELPGQELPDPEGTSGGENGIAESAAEPVEGMEEAAQPGEAAQPAEPDAAGADPAADATVVASGVLPSGVAWEITEDNGVYSLWASGSGEYTVNQEAAAYSDKIQNLHIEEGVTAIGESAFWGYTAVEYVSLPASLESLGKSAFHGCTSLKVLVVPAGVKVIPEDLAAGCTALEYVEFAEGVTEIGEAALAWCTSLTDCQIPSTVVTFGTGVFEGCEKLTEAVIPAGVTELPERLFKGCLALASVSVPDALTTIRKQAFADCASLPAITLQKAVTTFDKNVFPGCPLLKIYGWRRSVAHKYATYYNIPFVPIGIDISAKAVITVPDVVYTGTARTPKPQVKVDGTLLSAGRDYTVGYRNNTNAGTAYVIVTGAGDYVGRAEQAFAVRRRSIENATVTGITNKVYTGGAVTQNPVVKLGGRTLVKNVDYKLAYKNNKAPGTAYVKITGIGNYRSYIIRSFKITSPNLSNAKVGAISPKTYNGKAYTPKPTVTLGGRKLVEGTHYTLSYRNNVNAGTATVIITGRGYVKGQTTRNFTIRRASVANAKVTGVKDAAYTGSPIRPVPTVTLNGRTLTRGRDYTLGYRNNTMPGTAYVIVSGVGNFTGSVSKSFKITGSASVNIRNATMSSISSRTYTGSQHRPAVTLRYKGRTLVRGTDYTVSYGSNTNVGRGTVTVTGKGLFTGSRIATFIINPRGTTIRSASGGTGSITVYWNPVSSQVGGYEVRVGSSVTRVAGSSRSNTTIRNLKSKTTYSVSVRTYYTTGGTTYYSSWSSSRSVTTK